MILAFTQENHTEEVFLTEKDAAPEVIWNRMIDKVGDIVCIDFHIFWMWIFLFEDWVPETTKKIGELG